jgi:hypothetical protein
MFCFLRQFSICWYNSLYYADTSGIQKSIDYGKTFEETGLERCAIFDLIITKNHQIVAIGRNDSRYYFYISNNFGCSWKEVTNTVPFSNDLIKIYNLPDSTFLFFKNMEVNHLHIRLLLKYLIKTYIDTNHYIILKIIKNIRELI